ncbi:hypothetical protein D0Y65_047527 [Glycine soja]|uniref:Uncharacterized protein n=1 Tax=Glycine soja TaxID=3848 RepID=A0A445FP65_GLYSO|nr:hypothetical protein JHK86_049237 [Glycine max]RZB50681.1 hypothetical protein D0Y65_047527 [Glycine soja]
MILPMSYLVGIVKKNADHPHAGRNDEFISCCSKQLKSKETNDQIRRSTTDSGSDLIMLVRKYSGQNFYERKLFLRPKAFKVTFHPPKAPSILQVEWKPPPCNWIKYNTYGAARGYPGSAACGGIFRDRSVATLGCFFVNLGIASAFHAELQWAMLVKQHSKRVGLVYD